jgi:hypothetical protein
MEEEGSIKSSRQENDKNYVWEWIKDKSEELFVLIVPYDPIKEYPKRFLFGLGSILVFLVFAFFAGLFYYLFETNKGTVFLSPRSQQDNTAKCEVVPATNTGNFLATRDGLWGGAQGFQYSNAFLSLSAVNLQVTEKEYRKRFTVLGQGLKQIGNQMKNSDLGLNMLFWLSFSALYDPSNTANRVSLIGDPAVALNRQYTFGSISSARGDCYFDDAPVVFDPASSIMTYSIPYESYNKTCSHIGGDPRNLGANQFTTASNFDVKIDVKSLITALAVNYGILKYEYLIEIPALKQEDRSLNLTVKAFYDPKYPGMSPIQCFTKDKCAIRVGPTNMGVPFFHQ